MTGVWALAALWLGLALVASLLSIWFRISTALSEIVVGTIAQLIIGAAVGSAILGIDESWIKFLSGIGAIILTFLAGAELDPIVFRLKWKEAGAVGLASFLLPFLACAAAAHYLLGWDIMPSWLAGVAMSTTSVAVVYAVMLEFGFNVTEYGKTILAACFVTDLGTVVALGMIFAPFTVKTLIFVVAGIAVFVVLPWLTPRFFRLYGNRPSELETKFLLFCLLGMGALAGWADSEAVLPAYLIARDRVMTADEIRWFWRACDSVDAPLTPGAPRPFGPLLKLLLLTGQRRNEIAGMTRDELSNYGATWNIPGSRTKNGRAHVVPLSPLVRELIASVKGKPGNLIFTTTGMTPVSGWSRMKGRFDAAMLAAAREEGRTVIPPWTLHDLRRTFVTGMVEIRVPPHVVEVTINHISGTRSGVAGTYNRSELMDERKEALERWAAHVAGIVGVTAVERD